jgi:hypothetical protein
MDVPPSADRVDVAQIMKEIREEVQRKRAQGVYTDEEVTSLASVRLRSYADEAQIDATVLARLLGPSHDWNIAPDYRIRTTRTGLFGRLLVLAKTLVRPVVRLYTDHLLNRQAQLNLYFFYLLRHTIHDAARLQVELQAVRHRCDLLERAAAENRRER